RCPGQRTRRAGRGQAQDERRRGRGPVLRDRGPERRPPHRPPAAPGAQHDAARAHQPADAGAAAEAGGRRQTALTRLAMLMPTPPPALRNAMSIDVEDYFQVSAFAPYIRREDWNGLECRVERNVGRILELLAQKKVRATFFTLGWVAERYPQVVK